ncbi:MAG: TIGR03960 family B12-binding radical SAM protein [Lachnospiraceae bacterium]|jgi:radical SAM family uncharacterized protein
MTKLALSDRILQSVENPARYIGNEINAVIKDKDKIDIRFAMCFPDVYEIGMSHLGIQIIYDQMNRRDDIWCERVYSPWPDLHKILMSTKQPLFALESQDPVKEFDFLAITIQYEMCYTNILQILDLSGIPLRSKDRDESCPIVIGGGPCTYNPEPMADFFDIFYIGESETVYYDLMDLYKNHKKGCYNRNEFLHEAAKIPGMYVPSLYKPEYNVDGTLSAFEPLFNDIPRKIKRQVMSDLSDTFYPDKPVVPFIKATQDRVTMEIMRGCIRGCRFCQAGMIYRPARERSLEFNKQKIINMISSTGFDEISLSSLSSSDYSSLGPLLDFLIEIADSKKINISLPSLRIDKFSLDIMNKVQNVKKSSLTFAPEAGSQRMRDVINKGITKENIMKGASEAFRGGWNKVKLYFMLGLPFEEEEDRKAIAHLAQEITDEYYEIPKEERNGKIQVTVSTSFFVAKPFTPFQWASMFDESDYLGFAKTVNAEIRSMKNQKSIKYNWHEADVTVLEGVLARGDRRLCDVIERVYKNGGIFDAWTEFFDYDRWNEAFDYFGIDKAFYTKRKRGRDELFPWDFIDTGISKKFLLREWDRASRGELTENCRQNCNGCGAAGFNGGVCFESKN